MASPVSCQGLLALCWIELRRRRHPHTPSKTWHRFLSVLKSRSSGSCLERKSGQMWKSWGRRLQGLSRSRAHIRGRNHELFWTGRKIFLPRLRLFGFSSLCDFCFSSETYIPAFEPLFHEHRKTTEELLGNRKAQKIYLLRMLKMKVTTWCYLMLKNSIFPPSLYLLCHFILDLKTRCHKRTFSSFFSVVLLSKLVGRFTSTCYRDMSFSAKGTSIPF